jgi:hypothetical protein
MPAAQDRPWPQNGGALEARFGGGERFRIAWDIFKLRGALERVDQRGQPRRTVGSGSLSSGIGMLVTLAHGSILRLLFVLKPTPGSPWGSGIAVPASRWLSYKCERSPSGSGAGRNFSGFLKQ